MSTGATGAASEPSSLRISSSDPAVWPPAAAALFRQETELSLPGERPARSRAPSTLAVIPGGCAFQTKLQALGHSCRRDERLLGRSQNTGSFLTVVDPI